MLDAGLAGHPTHNAWDACRALDSATTKPYMADGRAGWSKRRSQEAIAERDEPLVVVNFLRSGQLDDRSDGDSSVLGKILFIIACIALPVAWGVLVNWMFRFWEERDTRKVEDEPIFPDYQI